MNSAGRAGARGLAALLLFGLALGTEAAAEDRLVFAVDVIRHGERTPLSQLPAAPHHWTEGQGRLTAQGIRQERELGSRMRSLYVDRYGLLPSRYAAGSVYVRSTNTDRTLMSARSFLAGLYPREADADQAIPVHTLPMSEDTLLDPCNPLYDCDGLQARFVVPTGAWQERSAALSPMFARWGRAMGLEITDLRQVISFGDVILVENRHNLPPPPGLGAEDVRTIIDAWKWARAATFAPAQIGRVTGRRLLEAIAGYLEEASRGKTPLKYVLFSAHDTTILSALSAMDAPLDSAPPYASRLNFSLFRSESGNDSVAVSFNDRPVVLPGCGGASCTLAQFAALLDRP